MATENALMAAALTPGLDRDPQRRLRAARPGPRAPADADGRAHRGDRLEPADRPRAGASSAAPTTRSAPTTSRSARFIALAACTGGELRIQRLRARRPAHDAPGVRAAGLRIEFDGDDVVVPPDQQLRVKSRRGRRHLEDRGRPVARLPGRPHQHRARDGHPGRRPGADPREDVREPPVLRGQARLHGRSGDRLRPAPRGRQRPEPASRRAHGEPGHPGRHGDAHRGAVRRGHVGDRQHPPDRPRLRAHRRAAARRWARASSAWPPSACRPRRARRRRRDDATRSRRAPATCCPTRCASCARSPSACARRSSGAGYGEVHTPALEYEEVLRRGDERAAGAALPASSTSRATCWRCART